MAVRTTTWARVALGVTVGLTWLALGRLAWAFLQRELAWEYVAAQSRPGLPWYYRVAGVWAGMEGSLLLFAGIVGVVVVLATRRGPAWVVWAGTVTTVALVAVDVALASPFRRLPAPAVEGFGMNPILEHPAMTIHPPLLYAGLAASAGAALRGLASDAPAAAARRWLLVSLGALTAAMTLGGAWSYLEQGWGGYWAWDPVENTSLVVWLAAIVALHAWPFAGRRAQLVAVTAPWALALAGSSLVRSGLTPSVHGFAEQAGVGWALLGLTVTTVAGLAVAVSRTGPDPAAAFADRRAITVVLALAATVVVVAGTVLPVLTTIDGGRASAVRGEFYSRTVGPLALVAVAVLAWHLRRHRRGWSTVAHVGILVLAAGVAVSTFDRVSTGPVATGATERIAGVDLRNDGVEVRVDRGRESVFVTLRSGPTTFEPRIVVYPERGGRLAEVAAAPGWWRDTLVVLERASDDGTAVVTVHVRRLMWLVWLGSLILTVGALGSISPFRTDQPARLGPSVSAERGHSSRRRARLRARRSSRDAGVGAEPLVGGGRGGGGAAGGGGGRTGTRIAGSVGGGGGGGGRGGVSSPASSEDALGER